MYIWFWELTQWILANLFILHCWWRRCWFFHHQRAYNQKGCSKIHWFDRQNGDGSKISSWIFRLYDVLLRTRKQMWWSYSWFCQEMQEGVHPHQQLPSFFRLHNRSKQQKKCFYLEWKKVPQPRIIFLQYVWFGGNSVPKHKTRSFTFSS